MTSRAPRTDFPLTRQGVRNLDVLPAPRRVQDYPQRNCAHPRMRADFSPRFNATDIACPDCGFEFEDHEAHDRYWRSSRDHSPMLERARSEKLGPIAPPKSSTSTKP